MESSYLELLSKNMNLHLEIKFQITNEQNRIFRRSYNTNNLFSYWFFRILHLVNWKFASIDFYIL